MALFNKYQLKIKLIYWKQRLIYWLFKLKVIAKQVFIPLAVIQLIRTLFFPTPLDVFLLVIVFVIVCILLIDWL